MDKLSRNNEWNSLSDQEKAKIFAENGDVNSVVSMVKRGEIDSLPEAEQRQIVANAFSNAARLRDKLAGEGQYSSVEFLDHNMAMAGANFSRNCRAQALDILLNPNGRILKDQTAEWDAAPKKK